MRPCRLGMLAAAFAFLHASAGLERADVGSQLPPAVLEELRNGTLVLADGSRMPRIGFGTVGVKDAHIAAALRMGIRLLDTAVLYKNEKPIARAIKKAGVPRREIYLISKVWPFRQKGKSRDFDAAAKDGATVRAEVEAHIKALGVEYIDLLLLHWPTRGMCPQWQALEELQRRGVVRSLGLSNAGPDHIKFLTECAFVGRKLPALVQTDLGAIKGDPRVKHTVHELVVESRRRAIALMSYSPLSHSVKDARVKALASELGVGPAQLALRYGLQRGFGLIFSSTSAEHVRSNLQAFDFELDAKAMATISCWRDEPQCSEVFGAVGRPGAAQRMYRRLQPAAPIQDAPADYLQPLLPSEPDPAQLSLANGSYAMVQARASGELAVFSPALRHSPVSSVAQLRAADVPTASPQRRAWSAPVGNGSLSSQFRLRLAGTAEADPAERRFFAGRYESLAATLKLKVHRALSSANLTVRMAERKRGRAAQHIVTMDRGWRERADFVAELDVVQDEFVKPLLARHVYGGQRPAVMSVDVSRNVRDFEEEARTRSMLWHWDGLPDDATKVIMYLNDVDDQNGCMVALRHNQTNEAYRLRHTPPRSSFFSKSVFPVLPRLWMSELLDVGYEPKCLAGPAGTLVVFNTNIVHRGSRPAPGYHRDFVLWLFRAPR